MSQSALMRLIHHLNYNNLKKKVEYLFCWKSNTNTMARNQCFFTDKLEKQYACMEPVNGDPTKAYCNICKEQFSVRNKGKYDIEQHLVTTKHKSRLKIPTAQRILHYFHPKSSAEDYRLTRIEMTWCYHNVTHSQSFRSMDCTSKLLKKFLDPKLSCARSKTQAAVRNVLSKWADDTLQLELTECDFVVVATDASNHKATKLLPVLLRYCHVNKITGDISIKTAVLNIHDIPDETAVTVTERVKASMNHFKVTDKTIGFLADNAPVNFGSIKNTSKTNAGIGNNVHARLQRDLKRNLIPIGCAAHILHNALGHAVDKVIPIDIENVVIKIYYHFRIYTQRTEKFKEYCEFVDCHFKQILKHSQTRWLSLYPCIERLLQLYDAFKSYFLSEKDAPVLLFNFFNNNESQFWTLFIHSQVQKFHNTLEAIQARDLTALEVAHHYESLLSHVKEREDAAFIPFTARNYLLKDVPSLNEHGVKAVAANFYFKLREYMETWSTKLINNDVLKIFMLDRQLDLNEFSSACVSLVNESISDNTLFEVHTCLNNILLVHCEEEDWMKKTIRERWEIVHRDFIRLKYDFNFLKKIVQYICVLPGTNSECERSFSLINDYWEDNKSQLMISTLESVMKLKHNINMSCEEFFESTKNNVKLLEKFKSSEKYENDAPVSA